jgi:uncharacterized protein with NRDE domain
MERTIDEALVAKFKEKGAQFDFDKIRKAMDSEPWVDAEEILEGVDSGQEARGLFLGTVFGITPSGKIYTPWANGNVVEEEAMADEEWREDLEKSLYAVGLFLDIFDDSYFACEIRDKEEDDEN